MYKSVIVLCVSYVLNVNCFPDDLTCKGVAIRNNYKLHNCEFISNNFSTTDIKCTIFAVSKQEFKILPISSVLKFTTVFYIKEKYPANGNTWCLGVRSVRLIKIDELPPDHINTFDLPWVIAGIITTVQENEIDVHFSGDAAAGFVVMGENCNPLEPTLRDDCISSMYGASYVIAPREEDFALSVDNLFERIMNLYFHTMGGRMRSFTLSTSNTGPDAAYWLSSLQITKVQIINASSNNFNSHQGILPLYIEGMDSLTHLYMRDCRLKGLHPGNFLGAPNLVELDLSENLFSKTPPGIGTLKKLQILNLSSSRRRKKNLNFELGGELRTLTSLRELRLSGLPISDLSRMSLPKSTELTILDLSYCNLQTIPEDTFSDLTSLNLLILSSNSLTELFPNTFNTLINGATLHLDSNDIKSGQKLVVENLQNLDLSQNRIIKPNDIISNGTIDILDLSGNKIINWTSSIMFNSDSYQINKLNLSNNQISVIDNSMGPSLNTLESVDIGNNPFDCQDCSIQEFQNWINTTQTQVLLLNESDPIQCMVPVRQKGQILTTAEYNITACEPPKLNLKIIAGVPIGLILSITLITIVLLYVYRFEIVYIKHLISVKRKSKQNEKSGCKYDVFVSYSSKDRDWVIDVLLPSLENPTDKYELCLHERDFPLGSFIMDNIVSCIDQSRRVLLVLSNNYIKSEWCKWELQMAQHRIFEECPDLLVLLELERLPRDHVPLHLRVLMDSRTYLEWPGADQSEDLLSSFWARMKQALGTPLAVSGKQGAPEEDSKKEEDEDEENEIPLVPFQPIHI